MMRMGIFRWGILTVAVLILTDLAVAQERIEPLPLEATNALAQRIAERLKAHNLTQRPVAVLTFRGIGWDEAKNQQVTELMGKTLQDDLSTMLIAFGQRVVERSQLGQVIQEIQRGQQGLTDFRVALQLGKMVPGSLVLLGSISFREGLWVINSRLLETERGTVLTAECFLWDSQKKETVTIEASPLAPSWQFAQAIAEKWRQYGQGQPLAVLPFRFIGVDAEVAQDFVLLLQEDLTTYLAMKGVSVVERSQLEQALSEIALGQKGLTAEQQALQLGRFIPGVLVLIGSIRRPHPLKPSNQWVTVVRIVDTKTATILTAERSTAIVLPVERLLLQTLVGHEEVKCVSFSPDGQLLASGIRDGIIKLWRVSDGSLIKTLSSGHTAYLTSVAFSPDGQILVSASLDGTIKLWRVSDGSLINTLECGERVSSVTFSPDGQILASGLDDTSVKLWRVSDGSLIKVLGGFIPVRRGDFVITGVVTDNPISFSPDGQILASYRWEDAIALWHVSDGRLIRTLVGHGSISCVSFSPDGQLLASVSSVDRTIKLWRVSDGSLLTTLQGHTGGVLSVAFSPDGQILASGSYDRTIKLWWVGLGKKRAQPEKPNDLLLDAAKKLVVQIAAQLRQRGERRPVAVAPFSPLGSVPKTIVQSLVLPLQEELTSALVSEGVTVLERAQLDRALEEIMRGKTGLTDQQIAMELGKFLPGSLIMVGSFSQRDNKWVITARVLETERGEGVAAAVIQTEF